MPENIPILVGGLASGPAARTTLREALPAGLERAASLYVHVPFCFHKCHYCDFYSFVDSQDRQEPFVEALLIELRALAGLAARPLRTIFVGGGTPTLLRVELWERLLAEVGEIFDLSEMRAGRGEFTVECNPETATQELMRTLRAGGVDRISIGAQSFDAQSLKTLERWHDPASVQRALALAAEAGIERRSVDLIYAIPGQTMEDWRRDVETALALRPAPGIEHLSCYALTYEPNTAMTIRLKQGEFERCDEDLEADMYEWLVERLRAEGLERYEVSNFARPGQESRHNLAYWRQESWLAAGPSASGHLRCADPREGGLRWKNVARLTDWMEGVERAGGWAPVVDVETPDPARARRERIMMGLRVREGLAVEELEGLERAIGAEGATGLVEVSEGRVRLTDRGFLHADGVARRLMGAI